MPHAPQFITSFARLAQLPDAHSINPAAQPLAHAYAPDMRSCAQTGVAPEHVVPHAPQCAPSMRDVSQPFAGAWSQSPRFGWHAPVRSHAPAVQCTADAETPGNAVQSLLHEPHRCSVFTATHAPLHRAVPGEHPVSTSALGTSLITSPSSLPASTSAFTMSIAASWRGWCDSAHEAHRSAATTAAPAKFRVGRRCSLGSFIAVRLPLSRDCCRPTGDLACDHSIARLVRRRSSYSIMPEHSRVTDLRSRSCDAGKARP